MYSIKPCNLVFDGQRPPYAADFSDLYFSSKDGLAEARYVFLDGAGLEPLLRSERQHLTIAETGFGSGLNFLATIKAWQQSGATKPLTYVSVEGYPMALDDLKRAWQPFRNELSSGMDALERAYPPITPGFHTRSLFGGRVRLMLLFGQAEQVLPLADFKAQAWYLDGFAPARNADLWNASLFEQVWRLSDGGARLATFSAARVVKDGCDGIGAAWQKRPGYAGKRECLTAVMPGQPDPEPKPEPLTIIGAGIAGAWAARKFKQAGWSDVQVVDQASELGAGASGNPVALIEPRLSHVYAPDIELVRLAYLNAIHDYDGLVLDPKGFDPWVGARGLSKAPRDAVIEKRFGQWLDHSLLPSDWMEGNAQELFFPQGGGVDPKGLLAHLLDGIPCIWGQNAENFLKTDGTKIWSIGANTPLLHSGLAPFMAGNLGQLVSSPPTQPLLERGPISRSGYLAQAPDHRLIAGASYQSIPVHRLANAQPMTPRADHVAQAKGRVAELGAAWEERDWHFERGAMRSVARDRNALVGPYSDTDWIFAGLGSRGFTLAPLLADYLVAKLLKRPNPLPTSCAKTVNPLRFATHSDKRL